MAHVELLRTHERHAACVSILGVRMSESSLPASECLKAHHVCHASPCRNFTCTRSLRRERQHSVLSPPHARPSPRAACYLKPLCPSRVQSYVPILACSQLTAMRSRLPATHRRVQNYASVAISSMDRRSLGACKLRSRLRRTSQAYVPYMRATCATVANRRVCEACVM